MARPIKSTDPVLDQRLDELLKDYKTPEDILGEGGLIKQLTKRIIEKALQAELTHHLENETLSENEESALSGKGRNSRNGYSKKTIDSDSGPFELNIPRDRQSSFEPILVPKHQRRLAGLEDKIIALYARGMSTRDIQAQLNDLYSIELSPTLISQVTDAVWEEVRAWQNRPLDKLYPIVYLDALQVKVRVDGRVSNHAVYVVLGVNLEGTKGSCLFSENSKGTQICDRVHVKLLASVFRFS